MLKLNKSKISKKKMVRHHHNHHRHHFREKIEQIRKRVKIPRIQMEVEVECLILMLKMAI